MGPVCAPLDPELGPGAFRRSALARVLLSLLGWKLVFEGLPSRQGVVIVYPHTSNWDFVFLILAKWSAGIPVRFWGKDSLFKWPVLGAWLRWLGGVPVRRDSPHGAVGQMARTVAESKAKADFFWLGLAPEGTRKWVPGWRSGFYRVALEAQVPLGICSINFREKTIRVTDFLVLSGNVQSDMRHIAEALGSAVAKYPAQAGPIQLREK